MTSENWQHRQDVPVLSAGQVHVWRRSLSISEAEASIARACLDAAELARAAKFRSHVDRERFIGTRGSIRLLLAKYLAQEPQDLRFAYEKGGKPHIEMSSGERSPIEFNISHSDDILVVGIALGSRVGIDVEIIRPDIDVDAVARTHFSECESAVLRKLSGRVKIEAFYNAWTRKEAYVKALGRGILIPLNSFEAAFLPGEQVSFPAGDTHRWSVRDFSPFPHATGALVYESGADKLSFFEFGSALGKIPSSPGS